MLQEDGSLFLNQLRHNEYCKEPGNCSSIKNKIAAFFLRWRLSAVQIYTTGLGFLWKFAMHVLLSGNYRAVAEE